MHLSAVQKILCYAILIGLASAAQNNQRSNAGGFTFKDEDSAIEGSGYNGEVNHDLESSGSGFGPESDDEDDPDTEKPFVSYNNPVNNNNPPPQQPKIPETTERKDIVNRILIEETTEDSGVVMNPKAEERPTSFFAQPGILAAVVGGAVVGLLCAILVVMFIVYRMRKKDEGSYALGEPKQSPNSNSYSRGTNKEFFA